MNDPREVRRAIRSGRHKDHTAGLAPGYVQGNLCILPREYAQDFMTFCQRNPRPCPIIGIGEAGNPRLPSLAEDLDIRTDISLYRVFRDGKQAEDVPNLKELWRDDLVTF